MGFTLDPVTKKPIANKATAGTSDAINAVADFAETIGHRMAGPIAEMFNTNAAEGTEWFVTDQADSPVYVTEGPGEGWRLLEVTNPRWLYVGGSGGPGSPAGFTAYNGSGYTGIRFRREFSGGAGSVTLMGAATRTANNGAWGPGVVVFTLPSGSRPSSVVEGMATHNNGFHLVQILANGQVILAATGSGTINFLSTVIPLGS